MEKNHQFLVNLSSNVKSAFLQFFKIFLEFVPMLFLVAFITAPYMDFRENTFISGYEYFLSIISHYVWNYLPKCGSCVFWNGYLNGGMPAFAELQGAVLHPLVFLTTLIWGVTNGSKIIVIISLLLSGIASWWLAKELGTGRLPRIWISLLGVVGGHIIGRLESGNIVLVLSVASAALVLPMVLRLNNKVTNRRIGLLSILLALLWLSGQGYIQIGVIIGWFPAFLFMLYQPHQKKQEKWIAFGKSVLLSIAICGLLIIPSLHFIPNIQKYTTDDFKSLQPLSYIPLNLVISDRDLYTKTFLGMDGFPYEHIEYIGWIPVIFSILAGFFVLKQDKKRVFGALFLAVLLPMIFTCREVILFLFNIIPSLNTLRTLSVTASVMVPPILGIAAWGLQKISELNWPCVIRQNPQGSQQQSSLNLKWFILIPIVIFSLKENISFAQSYISLRTVEIPQQDLAFLQLNDTQWVTPAGNDWFQALLPGSPKLIMTDRPWVWKNRQRLTGYIQLFFNPDQKAVEGLIAHEKDFDVLKKPAELYAGVTVNNGTTDDLIKCDANSSGGYIDVTCDSPKSGVLTVRDYQFSGWHAWVDGKPVSFLSSDWLSVEAQPGKHVYSFRYNPWDVYVGGVLTIIGMIVAFWMIFGKKESIE